MNILHEAEDFDPIEMLFPASGEGLVVALRAYFDASARESSDAYCLAGVAFGVDGARKASRDWKRLFGDRTFHMTDLNAKEGNFKGISQEEKDHFIKGAVQIIKRYAVCTVLTSLCPSKVKPLLPKRNIAKGKFNKGMVSGFQNQYSLTCKFAMTTLADKTKSKIHYNFELGDDGQGASREYIEFVASKAHLRDSHYISGLSYHRKESEVLLGTADLMAWEWTMHLKRQIENKPIRKSLAILAGEESLKLNGLEQSQEFESDKIVILHIGGDFLEGGLSDATEMLKTNDGNKWREIMERRGLSIEDFL